MIPHIRIEDYDYPLPDDRIARYPLERRDASRLLEYRDGKISEHHFYDIPVLLPENALMIFNDTKVVPARLHFCRPTGAHIEIFCLEPVEPAEYVSMFSVTEKCRWKCMIGNVKRWKSDVLSLYNPGNAPEITSLGLKACLVERTGETSVVEFSWNGDIPFSKVLELCGSVPIPPYLNRETEEIDKERYQTLYAHYRGSVAAPTAGLHFTEEVLDAIFEKVTLERARVMRLSLKAEDAVAGEVILAELYVAAGRRDAAEIKALLCGYLYFLRATASEGSNSDELFELAAEL